MITKFFRWLVFIVIVVVTGGSLYYVYQYVQHTQPCAQPITYTTGAVDSRFGITNVALFADAKAAAAIWNKAAGKELLVYDPNAGMKINLIYDAREANAKLGNEIAMQQANADAARATLDTMQADFAARQAAYNQAVDAVNARGGATPRKAAALTAERDSLNALSASINKQVAVFNKGVADLNAVVEQFNQTAGHAFQAGQYVRDAAGERINIFEFVGDLQLKRVLAHELGHAIGFGHNDDPKSIMYAKNESGNLVPTAADLAALKVVCGD